MSNQDSRSSPKWNAIRSRAVPANVTTRITDASLLITQSEDKKSKKQKEVLPAKLHRQPGYFESSDPRSSSYK
jgi:hypothetical protein